MVKNLPASIGDRRDSGLIPGSGRCPGVGNGSSLPSSCLENPMDGGAWRAAVHGVAKSQTWLSILRGEGGSFESDVGHPSLKVLWTTLFFTCLIVFMLPLSKLLHQEHLEKVRKKRAYLRWVSLSKTWNHYPIIFKGTSLLESCFYGVKRTCFLESERLDASQLCLCLSIWFWKNYSASLILLSSSVKWGK